MPRESDGFKLAEIDLGLRGAGEILGTRQHGLPRFAVAALPEDTPTLIAARDEVLALLRRHGSLDDPALGPLVEAARRRFGAVALIASRYEWSGERASKHPYPIPLRSEAVSEVRLL